MHVAEDNHLADRGDRYALDFLAVLADDQMLAAFADVGAGLLKIEDGSFVALRQDTRDAGCGFLGRRHVLLAQAIEGFLGLADGRQRTAKAAVAQLGGQWFRRSVAVGKFTDGLDRLQRLGPEVVVEWNFEPALTADVVKDAARDRHAELFFQQQALSADLDGVVVPESR